MEPQSSAGFWVRQAPASLWGFVGTLYPQHHAGLASPQPVVAPRWARYDKRRGHLQRSTAFSFVRGCGFSFSRRHPVLGSCPITLAGPLRFLSRLDNHFGSKLWNLRAKLLKQTTSSGTDRTSCGGEVHVISLLRQLNHQLSAQNSAVGVQKWPESSSLTPPSSPRRAGHTLPGLTVARECSIASSLPPNRIAETSYLHQQGPSRHHQPWMLLGNAAKRPDNTNQRPQGSVPIALCSGSAND